MHWPEYLIEAACLGLFMLSAVMASLGGALIEALVHGSGVSSVVIGAGEGVASAAPVLAMSDLTPVTNS